MSKDTFNVEFYDVLRAVEPLTPSDWLMIACVPGKGKDEGRAFFRVITVAPEHRTPAKKKMFAAVSKHFFRGGKPECAITEPVLKMDEGHGANSDPLGCDTPF